MGSLHKLRLVIAVTALQCSPSGNATDAGSDAPDHPDAGYPGPHPAAPQVQNHQGPVSTTPAVIPIFFAADANQASFEDFLQQLASSTYWTQTTSEYGVGALAVGDSIVVPDAPPATIDTAGIESWLAGYLDGTHADWPAPSPDEIFTIFYPASVTIDDSLFGTSCKDFNGFHYQGIKNTKIVYAIIPRCPTAGALSGFDALSATLSHELVEAATDPLIETNPAWAFPDVDHLIWSFIPGAEVADMCTQEPQSFQRLVGSYMVQRSWSNASALAAHDPCVPALPQPYFSAAPVFAGHVNITFQDQIVVTSGVQLAVGQTKTVPVQLFSDAPTNDWSVQAFDTGPTPGLTFAWDAQTGNNGDTLHLTLTRTTPDASEFAISAQSGSTTNLWFGFVAN
jgi:hypothetical protein